jgi:hypothetical protein
LIDLSACVCTHINKMKNMKKATHFNDRKNSTIQTNPRIEKKSKRTGKQGRR